MLRHYLGPRGSVFGARYARRGFGPRLTGPLSEVILVVEDLFVSPARFVGHIVQGTNLTTGRGLEVQLLLGDLAEHSSKRPQ